MTIYGLNWLLSPKNQPSTVKDAFVWPDMQPSYPDGFLQRSFGTAGLGSLGGNSGIRDPFFDDIELIEHLQKFALSKGVRPSNPDWFNVAIRLAAAEYLPKKRGRPKKGIRTNLLAQLLGFQHEDDKDALDHLREIDRINEQRALVGEAELSDREYCRNLVLSGGDTEGSITFDANRARWQKRLSAARQDIGKPKRPARVPK